MSSELNTKPIDLSISAIENNPNTWWLGDQRSTSKSKPDSFLKDESTPNEILELAKNQKMTTDVKKAVFQAIVSSEDYL